MVGFDRMAARPVLLLPPLVLDLFLWLGPHLRVTAILKDAAGQLSIPAGTDPVLVEQFQALQQALILLGERLNLFSSLSTLPAGIPSLMSGRMPMEAPWAAFAGLEVGSPTAALLLWLILSVGGLGFGAIYHRELARQVAPSQALASGWGAWWRLILLAIVLYLGAATLVIVALVVASLASLLLPIIGMALLFVGFSILVWLAIYLAFTPHAIIRYRLGVLRAMVDSALVVRWNTLSTVGFLLLAFGISWLTNQVWLLPREDSWLALLALLGHAFVSGMLLTGSYAFYQSRREWLLRLRKASLGMPDAIADDLDTDD